jgi:predicted amidohydrolase YtcJ
MSVSSNFHPIVFFSLIILSSCSYKNVPADLIVHNAKIYTVDNSFSIVEAMAIKDGRIVETGPERQILNKYSADKIIDAGKKSVFPGLIDAHCHFLGYGFSLQSVNLVGTTSWYDVLDKVDDFVEQNDRLIIEGRGWDQNDWEIKSFPNNLTLNERYPDTPVFLKRIDGHAAIANRAALDLAGIKPGQKIDGGIIETKDNVLTGLLIDNAVDLVNNALPKPVEEEILQALMAAQKKCFEVGLTTVDDAGLDKSSILLIDELQHSGDLKMRVYAMISDKPENLDYFFETGILKTERLNVRSVKLYGDGALGSRGACLLHPYSDDPENTGFLLSSKEHFDEIAGLCYENGFQLNTHCIGDSANRLLTDIYIKYLKGTNDLRWRIEHAQVVNKNDIVKFKEFNIIPSVQPTHATSDMYWAEERLGSDRIAEAYAYQILLKTNGLLALGTDFPVENISPFLTFYAAVSRKDVQGYPENGFNMKDALTREQALKGMTIWAAISNFEEGEKGSLEAGKFADFIILDQDIIKIPVEQIPEVNVLQTFVGGERVF